MSRVLVSSLLALAACGAATGDALVCPTVDWVPVDIPSDATAVEAWEGGKGVADATFGADATWMGGMAGLAIARDGTPSETALVSGWSFTFCDGMDQVGFSVGPPESAGQCAVDNVNCAAVPAYTPFTVDSPALIAAAFPSEGADQTYTLMLTLAVAPTWTVTNTSTLASVKVDPATGAVVP